MTLLRAFCAEPLLTRSVGSFFSHQGKLGYPEEDTAEHTNPNPNPTHRCLKIRWTTICLVACLKRKKSTNLWTRRGEASFSTSMVIFGLTEKVDVVHRFDTRQDLRFFFAFFVCFCFRRNSTAYFGVQWKLTHKSRNCGLFWLVRLFFTSWPPFLNSAKWSCTNVSPEWRRVSPPVRSCLHLGMFLWCFL